MRTAGPEFLVIGAMKAGTTALYHLLAQHPQIGMSRMKETDYFVAEKNLPLGPRWYAAQFPPAPCRGEVSPNYSKDDIFPGVAARVAASLPDARLIVLLRDPVARFAAHYRHAWSTGNMAVRPDALLRSPAGRHMLATSRYTERLAPWRAVFADERLLVLCFEDLVAAPQAAMHPVWSHLGLEPFATRPPAVRNEAASVAAVPASIQRLWRRRALRRLDPLIGQSLRRAARRVFSRAPQRQVPPLPDAVLREVAQRLAPDAARLRLETGNAFPEWQI
ncbi:MAG: sulfotransferase [Pseudomonadota bacterium]